MNFLRVAAALAAMMSESGAGGGGPRGESLEEQLARLREENARLRADRPRPTEADLARERDEDALRRGERPPSEAERAAREQDLRGPAQPATNESRQMRGEQLGRQDVVREEKKKRSGDEATRDLIRILQGSVQFHHASSETTQRELDQLRTELGDEEVGAHVALRDYHRALANHSGHPGTPLGNLAHAAEVERTRKAVDENPLAKRRLEEIEKARRSGQPVDFSTEKEAAQ